MISDRRRAGTTPAITWPQAALGGVLAAIAAAVGMALLRWTLQVRTVPERVMEWVLLFVSPDTFEAALQQYGFEAKRYGLYAAIVGMLVVLSAFGAVALRRRWSAVALAGAGVGLWLFTMMVVMPLTEAGFFALRLIDGKRAAIGGHLAVALSYGAVLAIVRAVLAAPTAPSVSFSAARRSAMLLGGGAAAAAAATVLAVRLLPDRGVTRVVVLDPQEPYPSGGIEPPNPHPNVVGTPQIEPVQSGAAPAAPTAAPVASSPPPPAEPASNGGIPEPPPARELARDKDGAVLPSGRRPGQLAEPITNNQDFYLVTKNAAGDPHLRGAEWKLRVDGDVQRPIDLDYASLRNLEPVEVTKTLECISNFVDKCELAPFGCDLISTARWKGARLRDVLELTGGLRPGVVSIATIAADEFTTALPIEVALDPDTLLVYQMNDQVLPREHGYPARVLVPGRYGMKSAKWVVALRPMTREFVDWYGQRNWSKQGVVKTMTRIDAPARGAELPPGEHRIAGIAYAGDRGVAFVEFSPDGGKAWERAELLEPSDHRDAWVRWQGRFTLPPNAELSLMARATDKTGALQTEAFSLPQPDGSTGWHTCEVRAKSA